MKPIDHIVFDIGQVLLHYDPHLAFLDLIPNEAERAHFLTEVCSHDWNMEQDRGRPWGEAEAILIERWPEKEALIRAFRSNWRKMVPHEKPASVALFRRLMDQGEDVTLLTNFATDTFAEAQEIYPILTETRGVTVSGAVGVIKPDPEIYRLHAETFGLDPARTLFIDDSEKNVAGAHDVGWHALHFTTADKLETDLVKFGLLEG